MLGDFLLSTGDQIPRHVIVLRPIDDGDAAVVSAWKKVGGIDDAPIEPEVQGFGFLRRTGFGWWNESEIVWFEGVRF